MKKWIDMGAQAILGLVFFVFGLNGFLNFLPAPEHSGEAAILLGGMAGVSYFLPVVKGVEVIGGLLLLLRRFSPLALLLLAPIIVQIFLFHIFLEPGAMGMAVVLVLLEAYLGFGVYRSSFKEVLRPTPGAR